MEIRELDHAKRMLLDARKFATVGTIAPNVEQAELFL